MVSTVVSLEFFRHGFQSQGLSAIKPVIASVKNAHRASIQEISLASWLLRNFLA
jgi:hypothetical protein